MDEVTIMNQVEHRKKGWTACAVSVSRTSIVVSTALGAYIEGKVSLFECGNVFAIVKNDTGEYEAIPISPESGRVRIYSRPLARYILQKLNYNEAVKLPAWRDGERILFCRGRADRNLKFHSGFSSVQSPARLRYENSVRIVGNCFFVSAMLGENLNERLSLYENGLFFALINDPEGSLVTTDRNEFGTKSIWSPELVHYVKEKLGTKALYGVPTKFGVAFSGNRTIEMKAVDWSKFHKINDGRGGRLA